MKLQPGSKVALVGPSGGGKVSPYLVVNILSYIFYKVLI